MWPRFLRVFANAFVVLYAVDAAISALHVLAGIALAGAEGSGAAMLGLGIVRGGVARVVVLLALFALPLLGLTRRLSPSVFVPLIASTLWFSLGALPLPFVVDLAILQQALVAVQVGLAVAVLLQIRALRGVEGWLFTTDWFSPPRFSARYLALYGILTTGALVVGLAVLAVTSFVTGIEKVTNGFVRFDAEGLSLADRTYEIAADPLANETSASDLRRIRLIGMMHIGEEQGYRTLFQDLGRVSPLTIVLTEGISDTEGALESGLSYEGLAEFLGVQPQQSIEDYIEREPQGEDTPPSGATLVNADLDVSDFDPLTIAWLEKVGALYSGRSNLAHFLALYRSLQAQPETSAAIVQDILVRRNQNLIVWIEASRINYHEIVVPWGALHLPAVEQAVLEMGFDRGTEAFVPIVSWWRILGSLFGNPDASG